MIFDSLPSHLDLEIVRLLAPEEKMLLTANSDLTEDGKFDDKEVVTDIPVIGGAIEDEANAVAGQLVKKYGYQNQNIFESIKTKTL